MSKWRIGVATGYHANMMRFRGLSKSAYNHREGSHSGLFLLSAWYSAPKNFSFRPEFGFLSRGGDLYIHNLGKISNGVYKMKATYFDIRVPIIYTFHLRKSKIQPYAYLGPVLSFTSGGKLQLSEQLYNGDVNSYNLKLSKGNVAAAYFGMAVGGGVKYPINILGETCFVGAEFSYELGFTDTYSKREKENRVSSVNNVQGPVASTRKFSGFELKIGFSIPLSLFKKKKPIKAKEEPVFVPKPVERPIEKPCYTLQEIQQLVKEGKDVSGKTICSVDDIHFDTSMSAIKDSSKIYLDQVVDVLIETGLHVEVQGHTDSTGSEEFNMQLSKERALTVVKYLADRGVSWDRLTYTHFGESNPLASNNTPEGRRLNRRVAFVLIKK